MKPSNLKELDPKVRSGGLDFEAMVENVVLKHGIFRSPAQLPPGATVRNPVYKLGEGQYQLIDGIAPFTNQNKRSTNLHYESRGLSICMIIYTFRNDLLINDSM